jgi:membrane fusion protein (multidrug efflux system)
MKSSLWTTLAGLALVLGMAGCAPAAAATPIPTIALDSAGSFEKSIVQASAEVVPSQEAQLSFVISGPIEELTVKEGDAVEAGQILATLGAPDLEYGVLQAEAAVREAEFDYEYWKLPRRVGNQVVERGPVAKQELETKRRSLDTARAELAQTQLIAPFTATVVSVKVQPGEYIAPGQVVVVLANLNNLKVETTDLSELNVAAVQIGQPATVYVEALDKEFQGAVTAISPISDTIGGDVVFTVTIQLDGQPKDLLWGMSADVEIQTEQ